MINQHRALLVLVFVGVGCHEVSSSGTPTQPEPTPALEHGADMTHTGSPACDVSIGSQHDVLVAGRPTGLSAEFDDEVRLRSFAWSDDEILVAVGRAHPWRDWIRTTEQHTLWRIPCENPATKVVVLELEGADFSWAEPSPDGRGLYFSYSLGAGGVQWLDYANNTWGPVTEPVQISQCWMAESPVIADDYVAGWAGVDKLALVSGGPCGFEAEWLGAAEVLELAVGHSGPARRRPAVHVSSLAADAKGRLWVASGGLCRVAQTMMSRGAAGLWRSVDEGARWDFVEIPELDGAGVDAVWAAATAPDRLLLRSECCYVEAADFCSGGKLLRSEDGGLSWDRVSPGVSGSPPGDPASFGPVVSLHVEPELRELEARVETVEGELRVRSGNGGQRWVVLDPSHEITPTPASRELELNGWLFSAEPDGLVRRNAATAQAEVVLRPRVINIGR